MVLIMEEAKEPPTSRELVCDNRSSLTATTSISSTSALSPQMTELQITNDIIKKAMKLELVSPKYEVPERDSESTSGQDEDEMPFKSPKSPKSPNTVESRFFSLAFYLLF